MTFLLDVNILIALIDPSHTHHETAHDWFAGAGGESWATCPITENGLIRIVSHPRYRNTLESPAAVAEVLGSLVDRPGHVFWPDDLSLLDGRRFDLSRMLTHSQVTDSYLLALAVAHGGLLATLDARLVTASVKAGAAALHLVR